MKWTTIKGYEDRYEISDTGRVRSIKKKPPRELKPFKQAAGYLAVNLYSGTKHSMKKCLIHNLVAEAFIGPKPSGMTVNHKDGVKTNNTPSNLEYLTLSDNLRHAHRTGLINNRGENHGRSKLTEEDVLLIWLDLMAGESMADTAREFHVCVTTIWNIWNGRSWVHYTKTFAPFVASKSGKAA